MEGKNQKDMNDTAQKENSRQNAADTGKNDINTEKTGMKKDTQSEKNTEKDTNFKEKYYELQKQADTLKNEYSSLNEKFMRTLAEYDNFRKRTQKERESIYSDAYSDCLKQFLPVFDNLSRAGVYTANADAENALKGIQLILNQFADVLKRNNIEAFGKAGEEFNPEIHNAVMKIEDENLGENVIAEVLQEGYKIGDKIIRYAMVKVAN